MLNWIEDHNGLCKKCLSIAKLNEKDICLNCAIEVNDREDEERLKSGKYRVKNGDTLWRIAAMRYGNGARWKEIYEANKNKLKSPDIVLPGTELIIP